MQRRIRIQWIYNLYINKVVYICNWIFYNCKLYIKIYIINLFHMHVIVCLAFVFWPQNLLPPYVHVYMEVIFRIIVIPIKRHVHCFRKSLIYCILYYYCFNLRQRHRHHLRHVPIEHCCETSSYKQHIYIRIQNDIGSENSS